VGLVRPRRRRPGALATRAGATAAFEYVVAHEVVHLLHRNHSAEFGRALGRALPDWADRKAMLERWEAEHRAV
jgi:predicted metal-dependent hydrolase